MSSAGEQSDVEIAKDALQRSLNERVAQLKWTLQNIQKAKASCLNWKEVQHEAVLLQSHLYRYEKGLTQLIVEDWANENRPRLIELDAHKTPSEQIEEKAKKSKRMQRGLHTLEQRQAKTEHKLKRIQSALTELEHLKSMQELRQLEKRVLVKPLAQTAEPHSKKAKSAETKKLPYRIFQSAAGLPIFVGKGAKGNAIVSFRLANGSDIWCHVQGFPGAHVLLKVNKGQPPDPDSIQDALLLALFFSKGEKQGKGEVLLTQPKYIRPIGKKEHGKVQVSKHSLHFVEWDLPRFQALQERKHAPHITQERDQT